MTIRDLVPRIGRKRGRVPARQDEEHGLLSFQREINRLFDDFFHGFGVGPAFGFGDTGIESETFAPKVDVSETDKEVKLSAELPGLDEKDVTVELDDASVRIRGEKKEEHEDKGKNWYRREQTYGSFHRVVPLPSRVDGAKSKAKFKKGKLTVTLPKLEEDRAKRRSIAIEAE